MSGITTTAAGGTLFDVAAVFSEIKEHNRMAVEGVHHMIEAGKLLSMLKARLPHGQFIKMALSETKLSRSTISRYMQMAANAPRVKHLKSGRDAMDSINQLSRDFKKTTHTTSPAPASAPASSVIIDIKTDLPLGCNYQDAEIVEPSPEPLADQREAQVELIEPQPQVEDTKKAQRLPKWIPDDAERLWLLAKTDLDKILKSDTSRERVLSEVIAYCHGRLDQKRDHLLDALQILPRLTQDQLKSLVETINTRWLRL